MSPSRYWRRHGSKIARIPRRLPIARSRRLWSDEVEAYAPARWPSRTPRSNGLMSLLGNNMGKYEVSFLSAAWNVPRDTVVDAFEHRCEDRALALRTTACRRIGTLHVQMIAGVGAGPLDRTRSGDDEAGPSSRRSRHPADPLHKRTPLSDECLSGSFVEGPGTLAHAVAR